MTKFKKVWIAPGAFFLVVLLAIGLSACVKTADAEYHTPETSFGVFPETAAKLEPIALANTENRSTEGFFGVSPELTSELEQIVLADARVKDIIEDRAGSYTVNGNTIKDKSYYIAVGVRFKDDMTADKFREWVGSGRQDSSLIKEFVGVIYAGYDSWYHIVIDKEKQELKEIVREKLSGSIPELTLDDKQRAIKIALADATVQKILEGKQYQIAPEGRIGVWHEGAKKLGAVFEVHFDKPYFISYEVAVNGREPYIFSGEVKIITIDVLFEENRVETIIPQTPIMQY